MGFNRIAGYAGIVFIVLMVINVVLSGGSPMPGDSITELRDYVSGDIGMHKAGLFASILVLPHAALVFAAVIAKVRISDAVNGESWSTVALLGAALIGASAGIGDVPVGTALYRGGDSLDDSTLRALWDGQLIAYSASGSSHRAGGQCRYADAPTGSLAPVVSHARGSSCGTRSSWADLGRRRLQHW